jgi:uncharacterized protein YjbJ (UPF0337 family)
MNKHQLQGIAREVKGMAEKNLGRITGNERTQLHGAVEELLGKAESMAGHAQAKVEKLKDRARIITHRDIA